MERVSVTISLERPFIIPLDFRVYIGGVHEERRQVEQVNMT